MRIEVSATGFGGGGALGMRGHRLDGVAPPASRSGRQLRRVGALDQAIRIGVLVLLTLPLCAQGAVNLDAFGVQGDFTWTQLIVLGGSGALLLACGAVGRSRFLTIFAAAWAVVATYNVLMIMFGDERFGGAALRGVLNISTNLLVAAALSTLLTMPGQARASVHAVSTFGLLLALSAILEYALLQLSPGALLTWRALLTRGVDVDMLLTQGGVSLTTQGLARVGGFAGAPEVCGFLLSLSLPFVFLRRGKPQIQALIASSYALAAIVTGSRTLGIALVVAALLSIRDRRQALILSRRSGLGALVLAVLAVTVAGVNTEVLSRLGSAAWSYEWEWRLGRLLNLLVATEVYPLRRIMGYALGYGVDMQFGLPPVTSGLLGGDLPIAISHGGLVGLVVMALLWTAILGVPRGAQVPSTLRAASRMYLVMTLALSLVTPVLVNLLFVSSVFTILLVSFPLVSEALEREVRLIARERVQPVAVAA